MNSHVFFAVRNKSVRSAQNFKAEERLGLNMGSRKIPTSKKNYAEYDESTELEFTENPGGNHEDDPFLDSLV